MLGWRTKCAVEIDSYARSVLLARQADGTFERFPIWDDITTFDGRPWRQAIDVVSGGFPCQGISTAGSRQGLTDGRSGLWFEMLRVIGEVGPKFVFAENSPNLRTKGLGVVIEGLTSLGYDVRWGVLGAWHVGAPHKRNRLWIAARNTDIKGQPIGSRDDSQMAKLQELATAHSYGSSIRYAEQRQKGRRVEIQDEGEPISKLNGIERGIVEWGKGWWSTEPDVGRVADGVADRVHRLRAIGNGQVPSCAAAAWAVLSADWH